MGTDTKVGLLEEERLFEGKPLNKWFRRVVAANCELPLTDIRKEIRNADRVAR